MPTGVIHQHDHGCTAGVGLAQDRIDFNSLTPQSVQNGCAESVIADGAQCQHAHPQPPAGDEEVPRPAWLQPHMPCQLVGARLDRQARDGYNQVGYQVSKRDDCKA
jgi:hypothetical protein